MLAGADVLGALEHHVLEQVGEAGAALALVARAGVVGDGDRVQRSVVILGDDDAQAVGQARIGEFQWRDFGWFCGARGQQRGDSRAPARTQARSNLFMMPPEMGPRIDPRPDYSRWAGRAGPEEVESRSGTVLRGSSWLCPILSDAGWRRPFWSRRQRHRSRMSARLTRREISSWSTAAWPRTSPYPKRTTGWPGSRRATWRRTSSASPASSRVSSKAPRA